MKSLNKALDIIDAVSKLGSAGIRDISSMTGFPSSTVHRIAATLVKRQYFNQDPVTKNYSLSLRFLELGTKVQQQFDLPAIARPHLQKLMSETGESANLAIWDGDCVVYLEQVQSNKSMLKIFTQIGTRVPLYSTGVGKMLLSQWSRAELDSYLKRTRLIRHTPNTLVSRSTIRKELEQIYTEIDQMEKTKIMVHEYIQYEEMFFGFLLTGFLLLLLELILGQTYFRKIP